MNGCTQINVKNANLLYRRPADQNKSNPSMTNKVHDTHTMLRVFLALTRVGISGTTAKSRQRKFVPSSHTGPFALVASPGKSKTKVGIVRPFKRDWAVLSKDTPVDISI